LYTDFVSFQPTGIWGHPIFLSFEARFTEAAAIFNMALLDCQIQQERLRIWQSEPAKAHVFFKMRIAASLTAVLLARTVSFGRVT
jgi:hypothetical protein